VSDPWAEFTQAADRAADPWADFAITAPAPQQVAPSTPGSRFRAGLVDYAHGGAQLLANSLPSGVVEGVNNAAGWLNRQPVIGPVTQALGITPATPQQLNSQVRQREAEQEAAYRAELRQPEGELPTNWARIGGRVVPGVVAALATRNPQTLTGAIGQGAVMGAGQGAMEPVAAPEGEYWGEVGRNAGLGGITGGVGGGVGQAVGRALQGGQGARPGVAELRARGVQLTPGQITGGYLQRIEDSMGSLPVVGAQIRGAQRVGVESFNRSVANEVLAPLGQQIDEGAPVGRELLRDVYQRIGAAYDAAVPRVQPFLPDQQFMQDLSRIGQTRLPPRAAAEYQGIIQNNLLGRTQGQPMTGQTFRQIDQDLGAFIRDYTSGAPTAEGRQIANALQDTQLALRDLVARTNPTVAPDINAANAAFARYVRMERAAGSAGTPEGIFTPAQFDRGVRGADASARHGAYARGDALLQDLSDPARSIMPRQVPDSGTPERALLASVLMGAGGGASALGVPPAAIAAGAGGYAAYTEPGRRVIQSLLAGRRPDAVAAGGRALARGGVGAGGAIPLVDLLLAPQGP
jgi:hypothetical protein